jgi:hypothetical protein
MTNDLQGGMSLKNLYLEESLFRRCKSSFHERMRWACFFARGCIRFHIRFRALKESTIPQGFSLDKVVRGESCTGPCISRLLYFGK